MISLTATLTCGLIELLPILATLLWPNTTIVITPYTVIGSTTPLSVDHWHYIIAYAWDMAVIGREGPLARTIASTCGLIYSGVIATSTWLVGHMGLQYHTVVGLLKMHTVIVCGYLVVNATLAVIQQLVGTTLSRWLFESITAASRVVIQLLTLLDLTVALGQMAATVGGTVTVNGTYRGNPFGGSLQWYYYIVNLFGHLFDNLFVSSQQPYSGWFLKSVILTVMLRQIGLGLQLLTLQCGPILHCITNNNLLHRFTRRGALDTRHENRSIVLKQFRRLGNTVMDSVERVRTYLRDTDGRLYSYPLLRIIGLSCNCEVYRPQSHA